MLQKLLRKYPKEKWDWYQLQNNPNIRMADVLTFIPPDEIAYYDLSHTLPLSDLKNNIDNLVWHQVSCNPNINMSFVMQNIDQIWDWPELSRNPGITLKDIENNSQLSWNPVFVSENPNVNMSYALTHDVSWNMLSSNPGITMDDISKHIEFPWNFSEIAQNPNINISFIKKYHDRFTVRDWISLSERVQLKDLDLNFPWDWRGIVKNPNIKMSYILKHDFDIQYASILISNPAISMSDIFENPQIFTPETNPFIMSNPNITMEIVDYLLKVYPKRFQIFAMSLLSSNTFDFYKIVRDKKKKDLRPHLSLLNSQKYIKINNKWVKSKTDNRLPNDIINHIEKFL